MIDSEQIISEYGIVMELTSGYSATSERFLPHPKDQIKAAILSALNREKDVKQLDALISGYVRLAAFLSDEDAIVVRRFEDFVRDKADNQSKYPGDATLQAKYSQIQNNIAKEMEKLSKEIGIS
ncbi:MAG: hypothetical protein Q8P75_04380 [bacterium]|nr:hypothetical protein [bacterium]